MKKLIIVIFLLCAACLFAFPEGSGKGLAPGIVATGLAALFVFGGGLASLAYLSYEELRASRLRKRKIRALVSSNGKMLEVRGSKGSVDPGAEIRLFIEEKRHIVDMKADAKGSFRASFDSIFAKAGEIVIITAKSSGRRQKKKAVKAENPCH